MKNIMAILYPIATYAPLDVQPFSNIVGTVMYKMICTRPYIAYFVSVVSRFTSSPEREHWPALKWLMRYIAGSLKLGLQYEGRNFTSPLSRYIDFDYGGWLDTRNSMSGYIFFALGAGMIWKPILQKVVVLSTTEAKYMAALDGMKELIRELPISKQEVTWHYNNQSFVFLMKKPSYPE